MTRKLIPIIALSVMSQTAIANNGCDSSESVKGWGAWCGIDTFLAQQDATAAGPVGGLGFSQLAGTRFDSEEFGGQVEQGMNGWVTYALLKNPETGQSALGNVAFTINEATETANIVVVFGDQAYQFSTPYERRQSGSYEDFVKDKLMAEMKSEEFYLKFQLKDEDGHGFPLDDGIDSKELVIGKMKAEIHDTDDRIKAVFGQATSLSDMARLRAATGTTAYWINGDGVYSTDRGEFGRASMYGDMEVNFSAGTWDMRRAYISGGDDYRSKDIGLRTNGTISGNTFQSTNIEVEGLNVQAGSTINGAFVTSNAQRLLGQADITGTAQIIQPVVPQPPINNFPTAIDAVPPKPVPVTPVTVNIKQVFTGKLQGADRE